LDDKVARSAVHVDEIVLFDAQTSGGLLIAVSQKDASKLLAHLHAEGLVYSSIIAEVVVKEEKALRYM
jgi:selenide,water dikinase